MPGKTATYFAALFTLLVQAGVAQDNSPRTPKGFGFDIKLTGLFGGSQGPIQFSGLPQALRTVPSNASGPLATGVPVTIPDSPVLVQQSSTGFSIGLAPQYSVWRFTVRAGVSTQFLNLTSAPPTADTTAEYAKYPELNQYGTNQRGVGTSLVYYDIYSSRTPQSLNPFGELEFRINRWVSLVGGYSGRKIAAATIETGYDQYDALATFNRQKLASVTMQASAYGSVKVNVFGPHGGLFIGATPSKWSQFSSPYPVTNSFSGKNGVQILLGMDIGWTQTGKH